MAIILKKNLILDLMFKTVRLLESHGSSLSTEEDILKPLFLTNWPQSTSMPLNCLLSRLPRQVVLYGEEYQEGVGSAVRGIEASCLIHFAPCPVLLCVLSRLPVHLSRSRSNVSLSLKP